MLAPVIAGVDGSAESLAAAVGAPPTPFRQWGRAAGEAVRRKRPLRLVHVWSRHLRQHGEPPTAAQRHVARRALRQAEDRIGRTCPEVRVEEAQVEGPATAALLRVAEQANVLGSRGLSGFTAFLVGSVALGVIGRSVRPVVLVRAAEAESVPAASDRAEDRDVVLGLDLGDPCDEVIEFAFEAARSRGARLRAVHAWQPPAPFALGTGEIGLIEGPHRADEWREFMTAVLQTWHEKYPGVEVVETCRTQRRQLSRQRAVKP
ncbi:universal stress protein [Streptomyces canus]|uniref:universal stress protein n=1 Tax=Streptomyces canus TaxID=58343 RepID=UPI0037F178D3